MSRDEQAECRGILVQETALAIRVRLPDTYKAWWIPRSQIGYLRKDHETNGNTYITFTLPEWMVENKNCWELVP